MDISDFLDLAQAYSDLGDAVQGQLRDIVDDPDADVNPNAVDLIAQRLLPIARQVDPDLADQIGSAVDAWQQVAS